MPTAHNAQGWGAALWVWLRGNGYAPLLRIGIAQGNAYPSNCVKGEAQHGPNGEGWQQGKLTFCHGADDHQPAKTDGIQKDIADKLGPPGSCRKLKKQLRKMQLKYNDKCIRTT